MQLSETLVLLVMREIESANERQGSIDTPITNTDIQEWLKDHYNLEASRKDIQAVRTELGRL